MWKFREKSIPPPAPPPPPAKPTRITPARETLSDVEQHKSSARDKSTERTQPKIGALPKDVMQELTGQLPIFLFTKQHSHSVEMIFCNTTLLN